MGKNKKRKLMNEEDELPSTSHPLSPSPTPSTSTSELRNWAELPELPLHCILTANTDLPDFLSFSSVCRSWKSTSITSPTSFPPLLLLPPLSPHRCRLQTLLTRRTFQSKISPETLTQTCLGYSNGRLIFLPSRKPLVVNVFTGEVTWISRPPLDGFPHITLFADQNLFLLTSKSLLSYRPGTDSWSRLAIPDPTWDIVSLAFHRGKLFALDSMSRLMVVDLGRGEDETFIGGWNLMEVAAPVKPVVFFTIFNHRLVECGGELLLLRCSVMVQCRPFRCRITVYRLDFERSVWVSNESLCNWCIFMDTVGHCPIACPNPARWGGRSNCIYFAGMGPNNWIIVPLGEEFLSNGTIGSPSLDCVFNPNYLRQWLMPVWVYPSMLFSGTNN